ncbi:hypothetical protein OH76DRAFT_883315 [Lentinus brumalis]|uniref:Uncharacterized protein n=1 Tax=Lentinus brumalis TaxID=2498619 RepID=A0A371DRV0_9APHY|nr:hypothetical protein OH76DRAFT_883315 [Polyporus brumalis]
MRYTRRREALCIFDSLFLPKLTFSLGAHFSRRDSSAASSLIYGMSWPPFSLPANKPSGSTSATYDPVQLPRLLLNSLIHLRPLRRTIVPLLQGSEVLQLTAIRALPAFRDLRPHEAQASSPTTAIRERSGVGTLLQAPSCEDAAAARSLAGPCPCHLRFIPPAIEC